MAAVIRCFLAVSTPGNSEKSKDFQMIVECQAPKIVWISILVSRLAIYAKVPLSPRLRFGGSGLRERAHDAVEGGFHLEADAGDVGQADEAILDRTIVGEAAERGEYVGVAFVAAEPAPARDIQ